MPHHGVGGEGAMSENIVPLLVPHWNSIGIPLENDHFRCENMAVERV